MSEANSEEAKVLDEAERWLNHPYTVKFQNYLAMRAQAFRDALAAGTFFDEDNPMKTHANTSMVLNVCRELEWFSDIERSDLEQIFLEVATDE